MRLLIRLNKKRLSQIAYNERSRSGWTCDTPQKSVTYVSSTFVTLVSGPNTPEGEGTKIHPLPRCVGEGRVRAKKL